jgi:curved DNA-binding protein CbpA
MTLFTPIWGTRICYNVYHAPIRLFHRTPCFRSTETFPNHYETLGLQQNATAGEIKKYAVNVPLLRFILESISTEIEMMRTNTKVKTRQFYALSKLYHPDLSPAPDASQKFVKISEAYHVLGSTTKRVSYDRDYSRVHSPVRRGGSHSSHTAREGSGTSPVGGRPASGLSRRRTQFRGPPPSFYNAGGYGSTSSRREHPSASSSHGNSSQPRQQNPESDPYAYSNNDTAHWDREAHYRTHETLRQRKERIDSQNRTNLEEYNVGGSLMWNFLLVSSIVGIVTGASVILSGRSSKEGKRRGGEG